MVCLTALLNIKSNNNAWNILQSINRSFMIGTSAVAITVSLVFSLSDLSGALLSPLLLSRTFFILCDDELSVQLESDFLGMSGPENDGDEGTDVASIKRFPSRLPVENEVSSSVVTEYSTAKGRQRLGCVNSSSTTVC